MDNSVLYMQQQAEQRVRRMQEQARRVVEQEERHPGRRDMVQRDKCDSKKADGDGSEQWLLLLLALLLHQNGARPELLLALLYLAL